MDWLKHVENFSFIPSPSRRRCERGVIYPILASQRHEPEARLSHIQIVLYTDSDRHTERQKAADKKATQNSDKTTMTVN